MDQNEIPRIALLIDAENVSAEYWPAAKGIAGRFGTVTVTRAYVCHQPPPKWAAIPDIEIIDGRPADGPNAADFLLAMDAAVMAAQRQVDGFVLMTADDGFAAVAQDLKRRGATVQVLIPLGRPTVPRRLAAVADLAILVPSAAQPSPPKPSVKPHGASDALTDAILAILATCPAEAGGWVGMSVLGTELKRAKVKRSSRPLYTVLSGIPEVELDREKTVNARARLRAHAATSGMAPDDEALPF